MDLRALLKKLRGAVDYIAPQKFISPIPQPKQPSLMDRVGSKIQQSYNNTNYNLWHSPVGQSLINFQKGAANVQRAIESPKPIRIVPQIQPFTQKTILGQVGNIASNIPGGLANTVLGKGIIDPIRDVTKMAGNTIGGRPLPQYNKLASPQVKLGYQIGSATRPQSKPALQTKTNAREIFSNVAGLVEAPLSVYGGGKVFNIGKTNLVKPVAKSLLPAVSQGFVQNAKYGGAFGAIQGLQDAKDIKDPVEYAKAVGSQIIQGYLAGGAIGAGISGTGYAVGATKKLITEAIAKKFPKIAPNEAIKIADKYIRNNIGQFAKKESDKGKWMSDVFGEDRLKENNKITWAESSIKIPPKKPPVVEGGVSKTFNPKELANKAGVSNEAKIQTIPLSKISGTDYVELDQALKSGKRLSLQEANDLIGRMEDPIVAGRKITTPISVTPNSDGTYSLQGGNNRIGQALVNGDKTIVATSNNFTTGQSFEDYAKSLSQPSTPQGGVSKGAQAKAVVDNNGTPNQFGTFKNVKIKSVPESQIRNKNIGDYKLNPQGGVDILVSNKLNPVESKKVAIHELVESNLARERGIPFESINKFDKTHIKSPEPGDLKSAPYHEEHKIANQAEKLVGITPAGKKIALNESVLPNTNQIKKTEQLSDSKAFGSVQPSSFSKGSMQSQSGQGINKIPFNDIVNKSDIKVKDKIGIFDYLRTPDRVLQKIGLKRESDLIRKGYESYTKQLPEEINKITEWSKQVSPEANQRIFRYLDGQEKLTDSNEIKVAKEIRSYLEDWADRLNLPKEKRISNYITHIFDKDLIQKEFDPDLAKLITNKVAGSVYDPFTQQRLGKLGYIEDTWRSLDAYVKRAVRKVNMDPALKQVKQASKQLEQGQFDYVKNYIDRINLRPTKMDSIIDNTIKQIVGYKFGQRPTTVISQNLRQMVYRGTLGLNPGSALKNLTQGANTYAKLGEKHTIKGYIDLVKNMITKSDELERVGVLKNDFIQDRTINATRKFWEKTDKVLFSFFEFAERINRGSAYYGAKSKGIAEGMNEAQAIEYAKKIVRDTQFTFGSVDTPPILQSDIGKTLLQFQSFNLKQAEFLGEMLKGKDFKGLTRFALANIAMLYTIGQAIGMDWKDAIPFSGVLTGETKLGQTPPVKLAGDLLNAVTGGKDKYGQDQDLQDRINTIGGDLIPFIPAGVQMKKTIEGLKATNQGYSESKAGRVQYPVGTSTTNKIRAGVFGKYSLPEARQYYDEKRSVLGEKQSNLFKQSTDRFKTYQDILSERQQKAEIDKAKEQMKSTGSDSTNVGNIVLVRQSNGNIKEIDMSFQPEKPTLTGNTELDKKLISKFNGQITSKANDIVALYEAGKITQDDAEKQLKALSTLKASTAKGKTIKIKKISMPKIKIASPKSVKIKLSKFKISKPKKAKKISFKIKKTPAIKSFKIV